MFQIDDVMLHKAYFMLTSKLMVDYLYKNGFQELATELLQRACAHDNSKVREDEFACLSQMSCNKQNFTDANSSLSEIDKKLIELHWRHNSHHPEHYENYDDMSEMDVIEMVCDWFSRSCQYKTSLMEFFESRHKTRFHFSDRMYEKIKFYCKLIIELEKAAPIKISIAG
jgi:hypothetical protein